MVLPPFARVGGPVTAAMRRLAVLIAVLAVVSNRYDARQGPIALRSKGRSDAPVTVYEMSDFQCPYCRDFALTTFRVLEREYVETGKVRFVYVNLPLTNLHPNAAAAGAAALCAARQRRLLPMHDLLFRHPH